MRSDLSYYNILYSIVGLICYFLNVVYHLIYSAESELEDTRGSLEEAKAKLLSLMEERSVGGQTSTQGVHPSGR